MGWRYRRSFKLAPGLRLNMSQSGFGLSVGPRGMSMSFGPRGTYQNLSAGGFSLRRRVSAPSRPTPLQNGAQGGMTVRVCLDDNGAVYFKDTDGNVLPPRLQDRTKKEQGETIKAWLSKNCEEINRKIDTLEILHLSTPSPLQRPTYTPAPFTNEPPVPPYPKDLGILGFLFPWVKRRIERENATSEAEYQGRMQTWRDAKATHEADEAERRTLLEERLYRDPEAMQAVLEQRLSAIAWPRETAVAVEVSEDGRAVVIDVDLPEVEDMPTKTAHYSGRGWKVRMDTLSQTKIAQLYMRHVHGIGFRIIGETFAALPHTQEVILSGYSQRPQKATGQTLDEYLYSVRVSRSAWSALRFDNLAAIDATESLSQFELRRDMSKTGVFRAIEPFTPRVHET